MFWNYLFHKTTRIKIKKSDKKRIDKYLENSLILLDEKNKSRFDCARGFLKELCMVNDLEDTSISLGWVSPETLIFLFVSLITDYENKFQKSKRYLKSENLKDVNPYVRESMEEKMGELKIMEKDTCYWEVEVEDIFPIEEFTTEEVVFLDNILDKIHVDTEFVQEIMLSTKQLIHLLTGVIREYENFKGKSSINGDFA